MTWQTQLSDFLVDLLDGIDGDHPTVTPHQAINTLHAELQRLHESDAIRYDQTFTSICDYFSPLMLNVCATPNLPGNSRGWPRSLVSHQVLKHCLKLDLTVPEMAKFCNVSVCTIKRRLRANNMSIKGTYSTVTDVVLDTTVREIKLADKTCGVQRLAGYLRQRGQRLRPRQVRESLRRVDPIGVEERRLGLRWINRRRYHVSGPNEIWHLDGHHKLVRWGFVTHGAIDGYSRLVTFLRCHTNNEPITVLDAFVVAVNKYGIPQKVRSDRGRENIGVADFMIQYRGEKGMLTGRSVHNQRIERLWRDVFMNCTLSFYQLFYDLEDRGLLVPDNDLQTSVLKFCFLHLYNVTLERWSVAWNCHKIRTAHHKTPIQLWQSQRHVDDNLPYQTLFQTDSIQAGVPDLEYYCSIVEQDVAQHMVQNYQRVLDSHTMNACLDIYLSILDQ